MQLYVPPFSLVVGLLVGAVFPLWSTATVVASIFAAFLGIYACDSKSGG